MSTPPTSRATGTGAPPGKDRPAYRLAHEPDGRSWTARENLVDILERELLGPAGGPEEVLDGAPDAAYLVGRIAPVKLTAGADDPTEAGSAEAATDVGDATAADAVRGVPLTAVDDSSADTDDDVEDVPQQRGLMIPASMGLRFQVPTDLDAFTVTASWGVYHSARADGDGSPGSRYRRTPVEVPVTVVVADLTPGTTRAFPLQDDVVLRVDRYDDEPLGRRLIEVALCNDRVTPRRIPVDAWLYQTRLAVDAGGAAAFLPVTDVLTDTRRERDDERRRLTLQYRDRLEFAIGRTCSVDWAQPSGRATTAVWTTWLPTVETPQTSGGAADELTGLSLDMTMLATASREQLAAGLRPIVDGYARWLDSQDARAAALPEHLREDAAELVAEARQVHAQLAAGLDHLLVDDEALRCFRFMNQVMAEQRLQTQVAERRAGQPRLSIDAARKQVLDERGASAHSWRPFQIAFILMQLPLLTEPGAGRRSGDLARAQLLFFPTGGGKTEAYLGLAAYTFAVRRRQAVVEAADGPLDGRQGVAVLMRYTLRLLTAQQFQRATALVCAAELARLDDSDTWGAEPFRIGLWVGTDVSPKRFEEAEAQLGKVNEGWGHRLTVLQVRRCPWCGTPIEARDVRADKGTRRVLVYCGDDLGACPFAQGGLVGEGLPVLTVDEEIYRLAPAFVIATVDKFARLAREGHAAALFGYVSKRCDRHGFVHPDYRPCDLKDGSRHPARPGLPAAAGRPAGRLRPPDLVIQDELHLISGALGTTVGLFESAVDVMASWQAADGRPVRPLVVASTATVRNAPDQVRALYGRGVTVFPPQVLDAGDTFFSAEQPVSPATPGRRYVGVSTTGVRLTTAEIRLAEILMAAGQLLLDRSGAVTDPYLTLVGYFNAIRELAGMTRYLEDDIRTALAKGRPWSQLPRRSGTSYGMLNAAELTGRVSSRDITSTLDQLAVQFDPAYDSTAGKLQLSAQRDAGRPVSRRDVNPYDAVLATSMLQVGVDVTRLGLMLIVGQPKHTAEYIQASSRVGRDPERPGLVVTLGNWARPRDLAHFEQFRHYHETFYARVEPLSVTPFSATSMERGFDGALVSVARVLQAGLASGLSDERGAGRIAAGRDFVEAVIERLVDRVRRASDEQSAEVARRRLSNRLDQWVKRRAFVATRGKALVYERVTDESRFSPLVIGAENAPSVLVGQDSPPFVVANSMREVQPEINLLVSPMEDRLFVTEPPGAPGWAMPLPTETGGDS